MTDSSRWRRSSRHTAKDVHCTIPWVHLTRPAVIISESMFIIICHPTPRLQGSSSLKSQSSPFSISTISISSTRLEWESRPSFPSSPDKFSSRFVISHFFRWKLNIILLWDIGLLVQKFSTFTRPKYIRYLLQTSCTYFEHLEGSFC